MCDFAVAVDFVVVVGFVVVVVVVAVVGVVVVDMAEAEFVVSCYLVLVAVESLMY